MNITNTTRNTTIDLLRALTMLLMLTVNDFWTVKGIPHWMHHAQTGEDMLGLSDIAFPSFLFCVGLSIPYAIRNMRARQKSEGDVIRHILSRSFALLLMGAFICNYETGIDAAVGYDGGTYCIMMTIAFFLIYNMYKTSTWWVRALKTVGWTVLLYLLLTSRSPWGAMFTPSWWGILGLIGWAYLFCALIYALSTKHRTLIVVWTLLLLICLGCTGTAPWMGREGMALFPEVICYAIRLVTNLLHIGGGSSHLLVMSGVLFSEYFIRKGGTTLRVLILTAAVCALLGLAAHQLFIISKNQGTLPWIFYTLAIDIVLYALFELSVRHGKQAWFAPISPAGTATLTCYLIPYVLNAVIDKTAGMAWSYAIPEPFGVLKCLAYAALCISLTAILGKLKIKLKI